MQSQSQNCATTPNTHRIHVHDLDVDLEMASSPSGQVCPLETGAGKGITRQAHRLLQCQVNELCAHPSYAKHKLSVSAFQIDALDRLGDAAFALPIDITQDRLIIDGYGRWDLAKKRGMSTIQCLEYHRTEAEALCDLLQKHRRSDGLNSFRRIELALDLKSFFRNKARSNQQAGGKTKGLSTLTEAERVDWRKEVAKIAHASAGNVSKVERVLEHASFSTKQSAREAEISINLAEKWSRDPEAQQLESIRRLRIERGLRKKVRSLVAGISRSNPDEGALTTDLLMTLLRQLSAMSPEQCTEFGTLVIGRLDLPCNAVYVTDELVRSLLGRYEV
jgi:hypothetical protein